MYGVFSGSAPATYFADKKTANTVLSKLKKVGGLIFYKDYTNTNTVNADYAGGSNVGTYLQSRSSSAPATIIDGSGIINIRTTSNTPRFFGGYYDATGFHAQPMGIISEPAATNLMTRTDGTSVSGGYWTSWLNDSSATLTPTATNPSIPDLTSISSASSQRIQYTGGVGNVGDNASFKSPVTGSATVAQNDVLTVSFLARSQTGNTGLTGFTITIQARDNTNASLTAYTSSSLLAALSTGWRKFSFTATITDATVDRVSLRFAATGVDNGDAVDYEVYGVMLEKAPIATSFVPTAASSLTRALELLTYSNTGNSNASEETIIFKIVPSGSFANDGIQRTLYQTNTKIRQIRKSTGGVKLSFQPNSSDSSSVSLNSTTTPSTNTVYIAGFTCQHISPYMNDYVNGVLENSYTAGDWIDPGWGTTMSIGSTTSGSNSANIYTFSIAKYNRALTSTEIAFISSFI